jgi:hypothetical protein
MTMLRATVNSHARGERSPSPVTLAVLPSAQQRLLHEILSAAGITRQPQTIAPHGSGMLVIKQTQPRSIRMVGPDTFISWRVLRSRRFDGDTPSIGSLVGTARTGLIPESRRGMPASLRLTPN